MYLFFYKFNKKDKAKTGKKQEQIKKKSNFEAGKLKNKKIKIKLIYISFKTLLIKEWPKHSQSNLLWFIRIFFGVYNFIHLDIIIKIFYIPNEASSFIESKNKIRSFWTWKNSKIRTLR